MIFDISQLTIHSAPNSAARSAFKWQFENWKTFWCLNKDHKINIPASHQCLIAGQMNKNGNSSRNINEIRNKTFTICIRPYSIWEKKKNCWFAPLCFEATYRGYYLFTTIFDIFLDKLVQIVVFVIEYEDKRKTDSIWKCVFFCAV